MLSPRERLHVAALCVLALAGALAEALSIGAVFPFMALLADPAAALAHPAARWIVAHAGEPPLERLILLAAGALLAIFWLKNLFLVAYYGYQSRFVCLLEARLAGTLLGAYLHAPYTSRLLRNSADRIRVVTGEAGRVATGMLQSLVTLVAEAFVIGTIAALLLAAQPLLALVAGLVVGAFALLMQTVFVRALDRYRDVRVETATAMFRWVNEGLGALKEIKVLGREPYVLDEFGAHSRAYAHGTYVFTALNLVSRIAFETAAVSAMLVAVIAAVLAGMPLGEVVPALTIFGLAAIRLLPSASRIMASLNTLRYYAPAVEAVSTDLKLLGEAAPAEPGEGGAAAPHEPFARLELARVSYRYPGSAEDSLKDVDLSLARGEALAVVGRSGSGKTTLADLLLGLLEPSAGAVTVNGRPVRSLRHEWRGIAGLVPQEFFLLDDTVRRNVAFGLPDARIDDAQVWRALAMARLEDKVRGLPRGLDSPVGERGAALSGGERQRLGIARALYTDPDILVLDEATSALDAATEAEVVDVLRSLRGTKTLLAITHRAAAAGWCDRVVVMGGGRVLADGPYERVRASDPAFAELVKGSQP